MKALLLAAKKVAGRKAGECKFCYGKGECQDVTTFPINRNPITPCPTCARLRTIAEWCWHEWIPSSQYCLFCHKKQVEVLPALRNRDFDVQSVRALLEDLGEWKGFLDLEWQNHLPIPFTFADILTTDSLIVQAATEYLEGLS